MIIRRAVKEDIEGLNTLLSQVLYVHHVDRPDIFKAVGKKYTDEELLSIIEDDKTPVFVGVEEERVVAHCFCLINEVRGHSSLVDNKTLYIDDLCVLEEFRAKGVGRAMYEYAVNFAKEIGCYNLTLNVWAENKSAMKFYEAMGLTTQKIGMEKIL